ncbi:MAG TPA: hypothetical protein VMP03_03620 [Methylomirabilota bacterium]|nr:hypothetical protein [Methylomirabilota bacterium]
MKPTTDRLRHDIDHGRSGDKVAFPDPAAAPLGVDDEAGGMSPTADDVAVAHATEIRYSMEPAPSAAGEGSRSISGEGRRPLGLGIAVGLAAALVILVAFLAFAAQRL